MKRKFCKPGRRRKGAPKSTYRAPYGYRRVDVQPLRVGRRGMVQVVTIQILSRPGYGPEDIRAMNAEHGVGSPKRRRAP